MNKAQAALQNNKDIISKYIFKGKDFKLLNTKNTNFEWLIPNFISKRGLNMVYAGAGSGKSMFALYLCDFLLKNCSEQIDDILYFDADNGEDILAARNANVIVDKSNDKLKYIMSNTLARFKIFAKLNKHAKPDEFKNKIFIIDSIRNFMNFNLNKDIQVTKFMADLQGLRDKGATVIFLHHQPKQGMDKNDENYKGATAFMDSVDEAFYLQNETDNALTNENELILSLKPKKRRSHTKEAVVSIDTQNLELKFIEDDFFGLSDKEKVSLELAQEIIEQHKDGISQSDLACVIQKLANKNYLEIVGRNTLWRLFDRFDGKFFRIKRTKGYKNCNKKVFEWIQI